MLFYFLPYHIHHRPNTLIHHYSILKIQKRRHTRHLKMRRNLITLIHIHLPNHYPPPILLLQPLHLRRYPHTRTTPLRKKIHNHQPPSRLLHHLIPLLRTRYQHPIHPNIKLFLNPTASPLALRRQVQEGIKLCK